MWPCLELVYDGVDIDEESCFDIISKQKHSLCVKLISALLMFDYCHDVSILIICYLSYTTYFCFSIVD